MNRPKWHLIAFATLAMAATTCFTCADVRAQSLPTLSFDADVTAGEVSPLLFGANHRWVANASGSADPRAGQTYPKVVPIVRSAPKIIPTR